MKKTKTINKIVLFFGMFLLSVQALAESPALPGAQAPAAAVSTDSGAPGVAGAQAAPSMTGMLLPMVLMFGLMWLLMIRPQQKKMKEQQAMIGGLQHGDEVVTSSGILGKITGIAEKVVTLEIADAVRIKMLKSQISQVVKGPIKDTV